MIMWLLVIVLRPDWKAKTSEVLPAPTHVKIRTQVVSHNIPLFYHCAPNYPKGKLFSISGAYDHSLILQHTEYIARMSLS